MYINVYTCSISLQKRVSTRTRNTTHKHIPRQITRRLTGNLLHIPLKYEKVPCFDQDMLLLQCAGILLIRDHPVVHPVLAGPRAPIDAACACKVDSEYM